MCKHVHTRVFSCFDTQIHLYVRLQTSRGKKRETTLFLLTWTFSPTSSLFLLNSFEWHKDLIQQNSKITDYTSVCLPYQVRDTTQEPCGRLSFMKEPKSTRGLVHQAICNLNITLPIYTKVR